MPGRCGWCSSGSRRTDRQAGAVADPDHPPPDAARRDRLIAAVDALLGRDRTGTVAHLAMALADAGIHLSTWQTCKSLKWMGSRWPRTAGTLAHKQDPAKVERAKARLTMPKTAAGGWLAGAYRGERGSASR